MHTPENDRMENAHPENDRIYHYWKMIEKPHPENDRMENAHPENGGKITPGKWQKNTAGKWKNGKCTTCKIAENKHTGKL